MRERGALGEGEDARSRERRNYWGKDAAVTGVRLELFLMKQRRLTRPPGALS